MDMFLHLYNNFRTIVPENPAPFDYTKVETRSAFEKLLHPGVYNDDGRLRVKPADFAATVQDQPLQYFTNNLGQRNQDRINTSNGFFNTIRFQNDARRLGYSYAEGLIYGICSNNARRTSLSNRNIDVLKTEFINSLRNINNRHEHAFRNTLNNLDDKTLASYSSDYLSAILLYKNLPAVLESIGLGNINLDDPQEEHLPADISLTAINEIKAFRDNIGPVLARYENKLYAMSSPYYTQVGIDNLSFQQLHTLEDPQAQFIAQPEPEHQPQPPQPQDQQPQPQDQPPQDQPQEQPLDQQQDGNGNQNPNPNPNNPNPNNPNPNENVAGNNVPPHNENEQQEQNQQDQQQPIDQQQNQNLDLNHNDGGNNNNNNNNNVNENIQHQNENIVNDNNNNVPPQNENIVNDNNNNNVPPPLNVNEQHPPIQGADPIQQQEQQQPIPLENPQPQQQQQPPQQQQQQPAGNAPTPQAAPANNENPNNLSAEDLRIERDYAEIERPRNLVRQNLTNTLQSMGIDINSVSFMDSLGNSYSGNGLADGTIVEDILRGEAVYFRDANGQFRMFKSTPSDPEVPVSIDHKSMAQEGLSTIFALMNQNRGEVGAWPLYDAMVKNATDITNTFNTLDGDNSLLLSQKFTTLKESASAFLNEITLLGVPIHMRSDDDRARIAIATRISLISTSKIEILKSSASAQLVSSALKEQHPEIENYPKEQKDDITNAYVNASGALDTEQAEPNMAYSPIDNVNAPGIDLKNKYSSIDLSAAQRMTAINAALSSRTGPFKMLMGPLLTNPKVAGMKRDLEEASRSYHKNIRAAESCTTDEGRAFFLNQAEAIYNSDAVKNYDKYLTGLEHAVGIRKGPVPEDSAALFKSMGLHISGELIPRSQEMDRNMGALAVDFQNLEGCIYKRDFPNKEARNEAVTEYLRATSSRVLDPIYDGLEAKFANINRADLIVIDGMSVRERMQAEFSKNHAGYDSFDQYFNLNYKNRSNEMVSAALLAKRPVDIFTTDSCGYINSRPARLVKTGYELTGQNRELLPYFKKTFGDMGFLSWKNRFANAEERMRETHERVKGKNIADAHKGIVDNNQRDTVYFGNDFQLNQAELDALIACYMINHDVPVAQATDPSAEVSGNVSREDYRTQVTDILKKNNNSKEWVCQQLASGMHYMIDHMDEEGRHIDWTNHNHIGSNRSLLNTSAALSISTDIAKRYPDAFKEGVSAAEVQNTDLNLIASADNITKNIVKPHMDMLSACYVLENPSASREEIQDALVAINTSQFKKNLMQDSLAQSQNTPMSKGLTSETLNSASNRLSSMRNSNQLNNVYAQKLASDPKLRKEFAKMVRNDELKQRINFLTDMNGNSEPVINFGKLKPNQQRVPRQSQSEIAPPQNKINPPQV